MVHASLSPKLCLCRATLVVAPVVMQSGVFLVQRRPRRGIIRTTRFDPAVDEAVLSTHAQLSLAAVTLALRKHITEDSKCVAIAKDVFTNAVAIQRDGRADAHIRANDPRTMARLAMQLNGIGVSKDTTSAASPSKLPRQSSTTM